MLNPDFAEMLRALSAAGADFLLVDAYAMAAHGVPRATGDLDIWVRPARDNAARVLRALATFGAPLGDLTAFDLATPGTVFQLGLAPRRIDILTAIDGVTFETAWRRRVRGHLDNVNVPVIGRTSCSGTSGYSDGRRISSTSACSLDGQHERRDHPDDLARGADQLTLNAYPNFDPTLITEKQVDLVLTCDGDVRYVEGSRPEVASQRAFYAALAEHGTRRFEAMGCWIAQSHLVTRRSNDYDGSPSAPRRAGGAVVPQAARRSRA